LRIEGKIRTSNSLTKKRGGSGLELTFRHKWKEGGGNGRGTHNYYSYKLGPAGYERGEMTLDKPIHVGGGELIQKETQGITGSTFQGKTRFYAWGKRKERPVPGGFTVKRDGIILLPKGIRI